MWTDDLRIPIFVTDLHHISTAYPVSTGASRLTLRRFASYSQVSSNAFTKRIPPRVTRTRLAMTLAEKREIGHP